MWDPYAEFKTEVLPNGLTIHVAQWPRRSWVAMGIVIHSGAKHDPEGLEGLAHFTEHLVTESGPLPPHEVLDFFDDLGGSVSLGTTSFKSVEFKFVAPRELAVLKKAIDILGNIVFHSPLTRSIETEREVILGEFRRKYKTELNLKMEREAREILCQGLWLKRFGRTFGRPESINRITLEAVEKFYNQEITPPNTSVVIFGGLPARKLVKLVTESPFGVSRPGRRQPRSTRLSEVNPPTRNREIFEISKLVGVEAGKQLRTQTYELGAIIPGRISHRAMRILRMMVYEALIMTLRTRTSWSYGVETSNCDHGEFHEFKCGCDHLPLSLGEAEIASTIDGCLAKLPEQSSLFEKNLRQKVASLRLIDPSRRDALENSVSDLANHQRVVPIAEEIAEYEKLTMSDIQEALKWFTPERRCQFIIRP